MIDRRRFVALVTTGAVTSIAGCSSGDSSEPSGTDDENSSDDTSTQTETQTTEQIDEVEASEGPAELAVYNATWVEADSVTVDSGGQVELVIGNRGGEPAYFDGQLVAESLNSANVEALTGEVSSVDEEIPSGETVTVTSETITPVSAGRYEATLENQSERLPVAEGTDVELAVQPHRGDWSETLPVKNELRMSVNNVQLEQGLHYDITQSSGWSSVDRVALLSTLSDQTLAVAHVTVENAGNETATVQENWFKLAGESSIGSNGTTFHDVENQSVIGATVNPGSRVEGWLMFRVAREAFPDATLEVYRDPSSSAADSVWNLGLSDVKLPQFELESMDVPQSYNGTEEEQELSFTVRNTGEGTGTFRGALQYREEGTSDWDGRLAGNGDLAASIAPGETATVTSVSTYEGTDSFEFRFNPFGETFLIA